MNTLAHILTVAFSLFILMNAIGTIPIFIATLKDVAPKRQRFIIFRELLIALSVILAFNFLGDFLLLLLGVTQSSVMISGGIILFLIALKMVFPIRVKEKNGKEEEKAEPLIVPLAIPLVAGPAVLAAVIIYSKQEPFFVSVSAIIIAWAVSTILLVSSVTIRKALGARGIAALERLMGLVLTLISVQMFLEGLRIYLN